MCVNHNGNRSIDRSDIKAPFLLLPIAFNIPGQVAKQVTASATVCLTPHSKVPQTIFLSSCAVSGRAYRRNQIA